MHAPKIAALLDLSDEMQRKAFEWIRRSHTGRWPRFRRMHALVRVGSDLVELAEWRRGGYAVVYWSLTIRGISWHEHATLLSARREFRTVARQLRQ